MKLAFRPSLKLHHIWYRIAIIWNIFFNISTLFVLVSVDVLTHAQCLKCINQKKLRFHSHTYILRTYTDWTASFISWSEAAEKVSKGQYFYLYIWKPFIFDSLIDFCFQIYFRVSLPANKRGFFCLTIFKFTREVH